MPVVEYFVCKVLTPTESVVELDGVTVIPDGSRTTYRLSSTPATTFPDIDSWMQLLAGKTYSWRHALFTTDVFVQGARYQNNPMRRVLAPTPGMSVEIAHPKDPARTTMIVKEPTQSGKMVRTLDISMTSKNEILINMWEDRTADGESVPLPFRFVYHPETGYAPIHEIMEGRNDRIKEFYYRIWFGEKTVPFDTPLTNTFDGGKAVVTTQAIADFVHAVGNTGEAFVDRPGKEVFAPMDFAIVVGWKAITKPIFPSAIDGDLLRLVHLSNGFRMLPGAEPLKVGDELQTSAQINAVLNQDSGKWLRFAAPSPATANQSWKSPASSCTVAPIPTSRTPSNARRKLLCKLLWLPPRMSLC